MARKRRIKRCSPRFVSLCPRGKNRLATIYKSDDGKEAFEFSLLTKAPADFDEKGELLAVVYAPEIRDADGDIADEVVVKEMAYDWARNGGHLDVRHDGKPLPAERAFVAESFLIQKGDARFADMKDREGSSVDVTGGWAQVIKIEDEALRKGYRSGDWDGVSLQGQALLDPEEDEEGAAFGFFKRLAKALGIKPEEDDMTKAELQEAFKGFKEEMMKELKPAKPEDKKADPPKHEEIIFKGDPRDPKAVKAHLEKLEEERLRKAVDWADPESLKKHLETIAKSDDKGDDGQGDKQEDPEIAELKKEIRLANERLEKMQKRSSRSSDKSNTKDESEDGEWLSKEDQDLAKQAREDFRAYNERNGLIAKK